MQNLLWAIVGIVSGIAMMVVPSKFPQIPTPVVDGLFFGGICVAACAAMVAWAVSARRPRHNPGQPNARASSTVIDTTGGGVGLDIRVAGNKGAIEPNVGLKTGGLRIVQRGPGTGMRVVVGGGGPAVGVDVTPKGRKDPP